MRAVKTEYARIDHDSARARPNRSARTPNRTPPTAEVSSVAEANAPAAAAESENSVLIAVSAKA